jgi:hypothetical protein
MRIETVDYSYPPLFPTYIQLNNWVRIETADTK